MTATIYTKTYKDGTTIRYDRTTAIQRIDCFRPDGSFSHCLYDGRGSYEAERLWSDILRGAN